MPVKVSVLLPVFEIVSGVVLGVPTTTSPNATGPESEMTRVGVLLGCGAGWGVGDVMLGEFVPPQPAMAPIQRMTTMCLITAPFGRGTTESVYSSLRMSRAGAILDRGDV